MSVANAVGFASVSESQGFAFAVASETSLDAKRSVASKFFDWGCDAVQQARENPEAVEAFRALVGAGGAEAGAGAGAAGAGARSQWAMQLRMVWSCKDR